MLLFQAPRDDSVNVTSTKSIFGVKRTINEVLNMIEAKATKSRLQSQPCVHDAATSLTNGGGKGSSGGAVGGAAALHRLFGRFRSDRAGAGGTAADIEALAGATPKPAIFRPVEMTLVPDSVSTIRDVSVALRHCVDLCTTLAYQRGIVRNTYSLRTRLVQHLFLHVIPLPLPCDHPQKATQCFWAVGEKDIRRETQADVLRQLALCAQVNNLFTPLNTILTPLKTTY